MTLRERFERLEPREQKLLLILLGVFGVMMILVIPVVLSATASSRRDDNQALREAIGALREATPELEQAEAERHQVLARYARPAPPLAGFLEQLATASGIEIPESQDRPPVPHGKKYEERSTKIVLQKVGMKSFAAFMEAIASSGHPLRVSILNVKKRATDPDSYDVSMVVSAFDRKEPEKKPGGGASAASAEPAAAAAGTEEP
jgi:general secretion pathway protein M